MGTTALTTPLHAGGTPGSIAPVVRGGGTSQAMMGTGAIWQHPCSQEGLNPQCVAIGNSGTIVFTDIAGVNTFSRTLSSSDHTPAEAIDQTQTTYSRRNCVVDAADQSDVRVALAYVKSSSTAPTVPVLSVHSFTPTGHDWNYSFPFTASDTETAPLGVCVSRDGQTIVATAFRRTGFKQAIAVFNSGSNAPVTYAEVPYNSDPLRYTFSSDASTVCALSLSFTMLFDTHAGAVSYWSDNYEYPTAGMALSGDGSRFAKSYLSDKRIDVYRKQSGTYTLFGTYHPTNVGQCYRIGFSDDGNTLVAGYWDTIYPGQTATVVVLDLHGSAPVVAYQDTVTGSGPFWNLIQDLSVAGDGSAFAVALTGSQSGSVPQLQAYARNASTGAWSKALQAQLPGSALSVDVSVDGARVAVTAMHGHMENPQGGGDVFLYQIEPQDLVLEGIPSPGAQVTAHFTPAANVLPGTHAVLLTAPGLDSTPQVYPGTGTLFLPRIDTHSAASGTVDGSGMVHFSIQLPGGSTTIGTTAYYQALSLSPRRLSQSWVKLTVVP